MQKFNKRGLSEVVTAIIVILLVLVAIGIIWVVVSNLLTQGSSQAKGGVSCLTTQLSVQSATNTTDPITKVVTSYNVVIYRGTGGGTTPVTEAVLVFKDVVGNTKTVSKTDVGGLGTLNLGELGTSPTISVPALLVGTSESSVAVAGVFESNTCNPSAYTDIK